MCRASLTYFATVYIYVGTAIESATRKIQLTYFPEILVRCCNSLVKVEIHLLNINDKTLLCGKFRYLSLPISLYSNRSINITYDIKFYVWDLRPFNITSQFKFKRTNFPTPPVANMRFAVVPLITWLLSQATTEDTS